MASSKYLIDIQTKGAKQSEQQIKGVNKSLGNLAKKAAAAAGAYFGARMLLDGIKNTVQAFAEQELAEKKLEAVLKSTNNVVGMSAEQFKNMASELQGVTKFGDEAIMGAQSLMLTFTKVGKEVMPDAIETVLNMSEAMGVGLKEQTIQLGKALNDPIMGISALSRVGVQLSDVQKQQIKDFMDVNDVASAQQVILGELETQFGGMAKEASDTLSGSLASLANNAGDAMEAIGKTLAPTIKEMSKFFGIAAIKVGEFFRGFTQSPLERQIEDMKAMGLETKNLEIQLNRINQEKAQAQLTKEFEKEGHARSVIIDNTELQVHLMEKEAELLSKTTALTGDKMDIFEYQIAIMQNRLEFENEAARDAAFNAANAIILEQRRIDKAQEHNDARIEQARQQEEISLHLQALKLQEAELTKTTNDEAIAGNEAVVESNKAVELSTKERIKLRLQELAKEGDADKLQEKLAQHLVGRTKEKNQLLVESFLQNKGMKIKEASADAAAMASKAYKALADIPIVGPVLAPLAGAAAFAFGMKQVGIIKSFATGGSFTTSGPELILVGDNASGREQVDVTPLGVNEAASGSGQNIVLNISNPIMTDTFVEESIIPSIREGLRLGESLD